MKAVPAVIAEVKRIREIFLDHHGVPISQEFVDFANAIGNLCDAALALALASAAVDVPVEAREELRKLREMLLDSNEVLRSAHQIAARRGAETNWDTWTARLEKTLKAQHEMTNVIREAQGKPDAPLCKACHRPKDDSHFHLDAPGTNWGAALHWFEEPDARPAIGPNTYRGEDGSVSVLGTSTGVAEPTMKAVTVENLEELVRNWRKSCCAVCEHTFCQTVRHQANELSALAAVDVPVEAQSKGVEHFGSQRINAI